jgi:SRSO17 transposase
VRGLLAAIHRKNCWNLAEHTGLIGPQALQRLLRTARWDADKVRDDVRFFVVDRFGFGGVMIADETGFVKKGTGTAGVQRHRGPDRELPDRRVPAYATPVGRALLDRRLYLPEHSWLADTGRCQAAGIPDEIDFATKPALARAIVLAALEAGVPAHWLTGDEVYGQDPRLRTALEERRMGYVLAIAGNRCINLQGVQVSVAEVAARVADRHWQRYRAGHGA